MLTIRVNSATSVTVEDSRWEDEDDVNRVYQLKEFTGRTAGKQAAAFVVDAIRAEVESLGVKA